MLEYQIYIENVDNPLKRKDETIVFFEKEGFKLKTERENALVFQRGNIFQNFFVFNPLKWKSLIIVEFEEKTIVVNSTVNTIGQKVMESEKHTWRVFLKNYKDLITQNDYDENLGKAVLTFAHKNRRNEYKNTIIRLIVGLLVGAIGTFIIKIKLKQ